MSHILKLNTLKILQSDIILKNNSLIMETVVNYYNYFTLIISFEFKK